MSNMPNFNRGPGIAEFAARRKEEGSIAIPMPDGDPIVVLPREFWPANVREMMATQRGRKASERKTDEEIARALLGDEAYGRWAAAVADSPAADYADGPGSFFFIYLAEAIKAQQGVGQGE